MVWVLQSKIVASFDVFGLSWRGLHSLMYTDPMGKPPCMEPSSIPGVAKPLHQIRSAWHGRSLGGSTSVGGGGKRCFSEDVLFGEGIFPPASLPLSKISGRWWDLQ